MMLAKKKMSPVVESYAGVPVTPMFGIRSVQVKVDPSIERVRTARVALTDYDGPSPRVQSVDPVVLGGHNDRGQGAKHERLRIHRPWDRGTSRLARS